MLTTMNSIRPLFRSTPLRLYHNSLSSRIPRRTLVTPTNPVHATVSNVTVDHVKEDPAEHQSGEQIAGEQPSGKGMFLYFYYGLVAKARNLTSLLR